MKAAANKTSKAFCNLLNVVLLLVIGWLGMLYYYHVNTTRGGTQIQPQSTIATHDSNEQLAELAAHIEQTKAAAEQQKRNIAELQKAADAKAAERPTGDDAYHIVFSTDCSFFQDWQTLLVFHSAVQVDQKGLITRIASGCDDARQAELKALYNKLYPQYFVHFTPDFKTDGKSKQKYDFYNKPYGVQHWLLHADPAVPSGTVVNIIDPDMIILRPMVPQIRGNPANIFMNRFNPATDTVPERVAHGSPVAQLYGLGAPWAQEHHKHFNRTHVCGAGSPCLKTTQRFGEQHFSVGPPYMVEKDDLLRLVNSWTDMVPRVYEKYPSLLAEMYAYSMAAAHTDLPHFTMHNLMVSNTDAEDEGWKWIDALEDEVCVAPVDGVFYPDRAMPSVLHYCQFYRAGEFGFQKRRIRKDLFSCDQPMMAELPADLGKVNYKNRDGTNMPLGKKEARRNAFMLCALHNALNAMVAHYKSVMCTTGPVNLDKKINVVSKEFFPY